MHFQPPRRVAIVGGRRIPFCRAHTDFANCSNQDMLTAVLKDLVQKFNLAGVALGDVSAGAVIKHSRDWNLARESVLGSGLAPETPAFDLQRACGTTMTVSYLNRCARSLGLARSLMAASSSSPFRSNRTLATALPMRPNPLIATFVDIFFSFS